MMRSEYPRPQFVRDEWRNLNGEWTYEFDFGKSGHQRGLQNSTGFANVINVPFCPESKLSGVEHKDFIESMFYHKKLDIPAEWGGKRIELRFGAVDYECIGYINGVEVGRHYGGSTSFAFDLTKHVQTGKSYDFVLEVIDELRSHVQASGKQSYAYKSAACHYTRVTGIWQTVWLECTDAMALQSCSITPDLDNRCFTFTPRFYQESRGRRLSITVKAEGQVVGTAECAGNSGISVSIPLSQIRPWAPGTPFLYDIEYKVIFNGQVVDEVKAYAGLRKIHIEGDKLYLNNSPLFIRFVLDQGFYPDGVWTAPSDEALKRDIELSMAAGFNGARLHQKVFEERFHYWADKLGYLTWGESASWGVEAFRNAKLNSVEAYKSMVYFMHEWEDIIERDYNHPSIIAWTPSNETHPSYDWNEQKKIFEELYNVTHRLDATRPCNECSGYLHAKTDLWTIHFYRKNGAELKESLEAAGQVAPMHKPEIEAPAYHGQPMINDEFGGFMYLPKNIASRFADNTWGYYGMQLQSDDEYAAVIAEQVKVMVNMPGCSGFCYTQLTDVEQEQNGVLTFDRIPKIPLEKLNAIFSFGDR